MLKNVIRYFFPVLLILAIPVNSFSQSFKIIQDGIEYAEMTREIDKLPVRINLLRLDLTKVRLDLVHAMNAAIGVETTSSIATRYGALAAINAGFFRLDNSLYAGDPAGVLMINNKLLSESENNRITLFINNKSDRTDVNIARLNVRDIFKIDGKELSFSGTNRQRKENEVIEYTPEFHRTTLTDNSGMEIVVSNRKIVEINDGKGSSIIPENGYVISASGKMREQLLSLARIGKKIRTYIATSYTMTSGLSDEDNRLISQAFSTSEDIVAGVPQLIKNGKIDITWELEKTTRSFVETRHPRTAVAKLKDGKFLMITVDGRSESSGGISLSDLAELLLELGAVDAMNLDGGGSTTMFLDGKVVNHPSDKEGERKVSDVLLVFPRTKK